MIGQFIAITSTASYILAKFAAVLSGDHRNLGTIVPQVQGGSNVELA